MDTFRDAWSRPSEGPVPLQADEDETVDTGAVTDKGVEMVSVFHDHVAKTMNGHTVEGVEVPFVGVLRAVDAGVAYPVRGWACRGCQYAYACKPNRPRMALVA